MSVMKIELLRWVLTIPDDEEIFIDEDGLSLKATGRDEPYIEIGGEGDDP